MTRKELYQRGTKTVWRLILKDLEPTTYLRDYRFGTTCLFTRDERQADFWTKAGVANRMCERIGWLLRMSLEAISGPTLTLDELEAISQERYDRLSAENARRCCGMCKGSGEVDLKECPSCDGRGVFDYPTRHSVYHPTDIPTEAELDAAFNQALEHLLETDLNIDLEELDEYRTTTKKLKDQEKKDLRQQEQNRLTATLRVAMSEVNQLRDQKWPVNHTPDTTRFDTVMDHWRAQERRCKVCDQQFIDDMADSHEIDLLSELDPERNGATPATDRELNLWLDEQTSTNVPDDMP